MNSRAFVVERRRLPEKPRPDPLAEIRAAVDALGDVPREATASIPDMLFHNRRVAKVIREAADRIEDEWAPAAKRRGSSPTIPAREQRREIACRGRRIPVLDRSTAKQLGLPF